MKLTFRASALRRGKLATAINLPIINLKLINSQVFQLHHTRNVWPLLFLFFWHGSGIRLGKPRSHQVLWQRSDWMFSQKTKQKKLREHNWADYGIAITVTSTSFLILFLTYSSPSCKKEIRAAVKLQTSFWYEHTTLNHCAIHVSKLDYTDKCLNHGCTWINWETTNLLWWKFSLNTQQIAIHWLTPISN